MSPPRTSTRITVVSFVATLAIGVFFLGGCRVHHLGAEHGRSYYRALDQQAASRGSAPTPLSADDARQVLRVHTSGEDKSPATASSAGIPVPTSGVSSSSLSAGKWQGASGSISLQAK